MNYNRNEKIRQITEETLIVGIDIAKKKHVARAQDDRGIDLGKRLVFENNISGFERLINWASDMKSTHKKSKLMLGVEPTGHYWLNLAYYIRAKDIPIVVVNPMHVKRIKEVDDNSPSKNDTKDARVIAQMVKDGRYSIPNLLEGVYAELRQGMKVRDQLSQDVQILSGRIDNWLDRYFPEFTAVFSKWSGKAALSTLEHFPLPSDIKSMTASAIVAQWREAVKGAVGLKKAEQLLAAARHPGGLTIGLRMARREIEDLIDQYHRLQEKLEAVDSDIEELLQEIPGTDQMLAIKGVNVLTVAAFYAEVGDITNYQSPRQIQSLAGLSLRRHESGKYKGQTKISKRGRKRLRRALYLAVRPMVANNTSFKALHDYYTTRRDHPLKKQESLIALCNKLIRVLFVIGKKQCAFDGEKMLQDMPQMTMQKAA